MLGWGVPTAAGTRGEQEAGRLTCVLRRKGCRGRLDLVAHLRPLARQRCFVDCHAARSIPAARSRPSDFFVSVMQSRESDTGGVTQVTGERSKGWQVPVIQLLQGLRMLKRPGKAGCRNALHAGLCPPDSAPVEPQGATQCDTLTLHLSQQHMATGAGAHVGSWLCTGS